MASQELTFKVSVQNAAQATAEIRQLSAATTQAAAASARAVGTELPLRQQLAAVSSLQRQRSAALTQEFKRQEAAAKAAASGIKPLGESIRGLSTSIATLQGPLGGIAGRLSSTATLLGGVSTEATGAAGALSGLAGPLAIVAAGFLATGVAVAGLGKALFDSAAAAADFSGKLFDLSQQTGVSVETLSALEVVATTTGGSIESIAQSLVIFQGQLDDAQDSGSKAGKLFKELGISTNETEQAFRDALTVLAQMPEGFRQTNAAAELFGRRGGKQVLAILKETNGDLDGTIKRFKEMGIVVSSADAKLGDEFNDTLALINFQLRALGAVIGKDVLPRILELIKDLSRALQENREALNAIGTAASYVAVLFTRPLRGAINAAIFNFQILKGVLDTVADAYRNVAAAAQLLTGRVPNIRGDEIGPVAIGSLRTPEIGGSAAIGLPGVKRTGGGGSGRGGRGRATTPSEPEVDREAQQRIDFVIKYNDEIRKLTDSLKGIDVTTESYAVSQSILNGLLAGASPELQAQALTLAAIVDKLKERLKLEKEIEALAISAADRLERSVEGAKGGILGTLGGVGEGAGNVLTPEQIAGLGAAPDPLIQITQNQVIALETLRDTFNEVGNAVGNVVQAFVLYGSAGQSVRQVTAQILAGVAAQAAVKAVFELAEGFAALALSFFGIPNAGPSAAAHFQAAGIYGAIAGVAAVAGRGVAGNEFNKAAGGNAGVSGSRGGANTTKTTAEGPTRIDAARSQAPVIQIVISGEASEAFNYKVVKAVTKDFRNNGDSRKLLGKG